MAHGETRDPERAGGGRARLLNLAALIGGYGFGQGSIFLAQTWLLAHGQLDLLALFGTHFAFAMLGIILVDAGALIILARHAASLERGEESARTMWQVFWETTVFRAGLAVAVIVIGVFGTLLAADRFTTAFAIFAAPAFVVWAINAGGLLDGLRMSGVSGASGSLAYAVPALALLFAPGLDPAQAGALIGAGFSIGYLLTVAVQFAALHLAGWHTRFVKPTGPGVATAARDGFALIGTQLPGQLYFRIQLLMCSAWLGPAATAVLVYVKQIINAATQLAGFVRRVEFPALVRTLAEAPVPKPALVWREQRQGTWLGIGLTGMLAVAGLAVFALAQGTLAHVGALLAVYSIVVAIGTVALGYTQGLAALGRYRAIAVRSLLTLGVGLAASAALAPLIGVYGFALADAVSSAFAIAASIRLLRARNA